ncbi:MAG: hypothetical protein ABGZ53_33370 [Fuerstiella sp.]
MNQSDTEDGSISPARRRPIRTQFGVGLMVGSGVLWFALFAIPFLPLTTWQKTVLGGVVFAAVQVTWWSGVALAGPRMFGKLTGWFRRSPKRPSAE